MKYVLNDEDRKFLDAATLMLEKVRNSGSISAAQLVSVAKLQHALSRLPRVTPDLAVEVTVTGPRRKFGEIETFHYWDIRLSDGQLNLGSGGHFRHPSTGGDSFTSFSWEASPGGNSDVCDYRDFHSIVPDLMQFPDGIESIDFGNGTYRVDVEDSDNSFLNGSDDEEPEEQQSDDEIDEALKITGFTIAPVDELEAILAAEIDRDEIMIRDAQFAYGAESCDICQSDLTSRGLYVDGNVRNSHLWANMCIPCFKTSGRGIAWGMGQLYAKQPTGQWRCVAGFRPLDD